MSYSVFIRGFDLQYVLETNYCTGATVLAESKCTIPFTTLRSSLFNLILGNSVMVQVVASNTYGDSALSPAGSGAVIQYVPDAPLLVANDPTITSATRIGLTWTAGVSNGGTVVLDYTINYS